MLYILAEASGREKLAKGQRHYLAWALRKPHLELVCSLGLISAAHLISYYAVVRLSIYMLRQWYAIAANNETFAHVFTKIHREGVK